MEGLSGQSLHVNDAIDVRDKQVAGYIWKAAPLCSSASSSILIDLQLPLCGCPISVSRLQAR
jgi:hypothetical protein